jgi:ATP-dependent protease HslVU (ClpYQ) peptidase subunit
MTTIVYDHKAKMIAVDSRTTRGSLIMSDDKVKWRYSGADLIFFAGAVSDFDVFIENYGKAGNKPESVVDVDAFLVRNGVVYECSFCKTTGYWELPLEYNSALGSGGNFALAALDFEYSTIDAVEYAKTKDIYTGGKVHVFDLESMRFL